ncbi:MAG: DUF488 domain-containing protein [candidate division WWE3 bacterium]|nr:DUF488 domain-containing protein [candidate division WWE3 bacterium]
MNSISTIGHSNYSLTFFVEALVKYDIEVLIDVRSIPYSKRNPQFNRESLAAVLPNHKITYLFRGHNLGGLYENVNFIETIDELLKLSEDRKVVLMCSEGDYHKCHRYLILTPALEAKGVKVKHITP